MHSSQYLRLAQAADENGWVVVATYSMPADEGTYPAVICICRRDHGSNPDRPFLVSMGVLPVEAGREAFFCDSVYDLAPGRATQVFGERIAREAHRLGEIESVELLRLRD